MPMPAARRWMFALPILLYVVALLALRMHLPTGDALPLIIALLAGGSAVVAGVVLVRRHRVTPDPLSSRYE